MGRKFSEKAILKAIEGSRGIVSNVAKKLDVSWNTARDAVKSTPEAIALMDSEKEAIIDLAEDGLYNQVEKEEAWALKYTLATIGKQRGFTEKSEVDVTHKGLESYQDLIGKHRGENEGTKDT